MKQVTQKWNQRRVALSGYHQGQAVTPHVQSYNALIEGADEIRVYAINQEDAARQIARRCDPEETFEIGRSIYRVNGFLAKNPVTRLRRDR